KSLWRGGGKTGHFPITFDRGSNGTQELMMGYSLYSSGGNELWSLRGKIKRHADGLFHGDMDGDGKLEIAVAASGESLLINEDGEILWRKPHLHSQHALMGRFIVPEEMEEQIIPNMQAVFLDRGRDGTIFGYNHSGTELWKSGPHGRVSILSAVKGWYGVPDSDVVLVSRRAYGPPILLNGAGEQIAEFPFPPANAGLTYSQHFAQHFDFVGDEREEVFIYNQNELWVYENSSEVKGRSEDPSYLVNENLPNLRISNATFYTGEH
ncbi:MAG: hypothetical protein KDD60_01070, partial [Bdellovibrionales bacterium]|nr:hypothetical protein [Bdellovibrionales bacterium]